ncbi:MAG: RNA methyltransferase [Clostridia bacterium]|nr:RNA methyltransferase [Clostridia bacterium]
MKEYVSSRNNEKIKILRKLANKKHRVEYALFLIEGHKLVGEYLNSGNVPQKLYVTEEALEKYKDMLSDVNEDLICIIPEDLYLYVSTEQAPQGIMAVCSIPKNEFVFKNGATILLESIRDAGNLGTIIRTAGALGIDNIIMSSDCADIYNPKTLRASMGAVFRANICISENIFNSVDCLKKLGKRVYAAMPSQRAVDIRNVKLSVDDVIAIGNEGNGISDELATVCDGHITIPMVEGVESLNASIAAAILMWELARGDDNV